MREQLRHSVLALAGIAALGGGTLAVTDAAVAKKAPKHAKKHSKKRTNSTRNQTQQAPAELTGDTKTQAEAAALAAVPGGTVEHSFAAKADNPDGAAYVVRVEKADGTDVAVLEDASFNVIKTVDAPQRGGHDGPAPLTGDTKTQAEAAALAAVPGGTVERSHAARPDNPDGAVYAVDVEKSDGSYVVVLEDASFNVIKTVDRPAGGEGGQCDGHGGPGGPGGRRGPGGPDGDGPQAPQGS